MRTNLSRRLAVALTALSLTTVTVAVASGAGASADAKLPGIRGASAGQFHRTATYPVYLNRPAGVAADAETVAEISAATPNGKTLVYTDAAGKRVGFLDISNPGRPVGAGSLDLAEIGHADDQPTSVAVVGPHVLVVVDESGGDFAAPSGRLDVVRLRDRVVVRSFDLGGQPDSIAVSPDGRFAAIAIENQRDEDFAPVGGEEGDLPQPPAGLVDVLRLPTSSPSTWGLTAVPLPEERLAAAGLAAPSDPEPEYVAVNRANQAAVTLQENNGVVVIDLPSARVDTVFSAGTVTLDGVDVLNDGVINPTGVKVDVPREPDAIAWLDERHVATANEGDWRGGTRGWSVFDTVTGTPVWDAGTTLESLATANGLHNDARNTKGVEIEGIAVARMGGTTYAFVGSERSNFVAVYDVADPAHPRYLQILPTTNGPEGLLPIPRRNLLAVSSEVDAASVLVRSSVSLFKLRPGRAAFPTIVSATVDGQPIGWNALGALSAKPGDPRRVYAASDAAVKPAQVYTVDVSTQPARITSALPITVGGVPASLDIEGVFARPQGGFWLANEGATGAANTLLRADSSGAVVETVSLPSDVSAHLRNWGLEGVTATTDKAGEHVFVAIQRPLWVDPTAAASDLVPLEGADVTRIGRYDVATGAWTWFGYRLEAPAGDGVDWMGLSEITAVDADTLAVIERDKLNGPSARVKRVYTVNLPAADPAQGTLPVLQKSLARDVLPRLRVTRGWTQEKLEGLTIGANGSVYAVTDNDALKDATGETVFLRLGSRRAVFGQP